MKSADREKLTAIFSDDLRYAHSSGTVDTKQSFIESLTTGRTKYVALDCEDRAFTFPAPGIALMTGRAHVKVANATGEMEMLLSFLSVWREENGHWRFLAWQSCKLPATGRRVEMNFALRAPTQFVRTTFGAVALVCAFAFFRGRGSAR